MPFELQSVLIVALAAFSRILVSPAQAAPIVDPLEEPAVLSAIRTVWSYSALGTLEIEASFRLDRNADGYRIVSAPLTNQFRKQVIAIIPGVTFAIFHVHSSKGVPAPSLTDRDIADRYRLRVYTIHMKGLYEYDPITKRTTQLRSGVKWLD